ncbi:MAG: type II toxin-antitoxin system VapC family toxin [Candidatus Sericytochromatia bacterium]|nr:type II toxin-antitoxin system VapC family toxin [Candidatus Tanganyikabacteria bacterium]
MILYLDTSSLLKLFFTEPHSDLVGHWIEGASQTATSIVTYVEVHSAVGRRLDGISLDSSAAQQVLGDFRARWHELMRLPVDWPPAGEVSYRHKLRALDGIHLSAAIALRTGASGRPVAFSSFDRRLSAAAAAEGFDVLTA